MTDLNKLKSLPLYLSSSICSSIVTHPIDVMKVRVQTSMYLDPMNILSHNLQKDGISFLFKGIRASILRNGSFISQNGCSDSFE